MGSMPSSRGGMWATMTRLMAKILTSVSKKVDSVSITSWSIVSRSELKRFWIRPCTSE
jgi:hypothetical protein